MSDAPGMPDAKIITHAVAFRLGFSCLILGTVNNKGVPHTSYAPYISANGNFYIYVSSLAEHTESLRSIKKASVLFIENEQQAKNLFARTRLSLDCDVSLIERDHNHYLELLDLLQDKHGST